MRSNNHFLTNVLRSRRRFLMLRDDPLAPSAGALARKARVLGHCLAASGTVCRTCAEHCDAQAIRFRLRTGGRAEPLIDDARCNACGECVRTCPALAIALRVVEVAAA